MGADAEVTTVTSCLVRYHTVSVRQVLKTPLSKVSPQKQELQQWLYGKYQFHSCIAWYVPVQLYIMIHSITQHSTNRRSWLKTYTSQNMSDLYLGNHHPLVYKYIWQTFWICWAWVICLSGEWSSYKFLTAPYTDDDDRRGSSEG